MIAILKKELKSYLLSPIGYIFIGLFILMFSLLFYTSVFASSVTNFEYAFYDAATILTFITPVLTMRMFAEERRNRNRTTFTNISKKFSISCFRKIFSSSSYNFNYNVIYINSFRNISIFWNSKFFNCSMYTFRIFIIEYGLYVFWYVRFKCYRKPNNSLCFNNRCIYGNVVFT